MSVLKDMTGRKCGLLRVVRRGPNKYRQACWWCRCACGRRGLVLIHGAHLRNGHTKSCGCIWLAAVTKANHARRTGYIHEGYRILGINGRYIREHRAVMERKIGRKLRDYETVHHKNGDRGDNEPNNLELWISRHPRGQRIADKIKWAMWLLATYAPHLLRERRSRTA